MRIRLQFMHISQIRIVHKTLAFFFKKIFISMQIYSWIYLCISIQYTICNCITVILIYTNMIRCLQFVFIKSVILLSRSTVHEYNEYTIICYENLLVTLGDMYTVYNIEFIIHFKYILYRYQIGH